MLRYSTTRMFLGPLCALALASMIAYPQGTDLGGRVPEIRPLAQTLSGYEVVHREVVVAPGAVVRTSVEAPPGKVVVGGGALILDAVGNTDSGIRIQESAPFTQGQRSGWVVSVRNLGTIARTVRISAICVFPPPGYGVVHHDRVVQAGEFRGFMYQSVPEGRYVLGGGASVVGAGAAFGGVNLGLQRSSPTFTLTIPESNGWVVDVRNYGASPVTVRVSAVYAAMPRGYEVLERKDARSILPGQSRTVSVAIPEGKVILCGGYRPPQMLVEFSLLMQESGLLRTRGPLGGHSVLGAVLTDHWRVSISNESDRGDLGGYGNVSFYVICAYAEP